MKFPIGKKIYLRRVVLGDVNENYLRWMNDPETNRFMETRFQAWTLEKIMKYVESKLATLADEPFFAICENETNLHIGNIKLGPINWNHRRADVSLFIGDKEARGRGYGTEAISFVCDYAFNILGLHKLCAGIYEDNEASRNAFMKAGFSIDSILAGHIFYDGKYHSLWMMSKFNE